jgi:hypothetical protein
VLISTLLKDKKIKRQTNRKSTFTDSSNCIVLYIL